ncbi:MAG: hypothetical protein Q9195_005673 [Heterodermia aff. obscurata]
MKPAIKLARDGFPVSEDLVWAMQDASHNNDFFKKNDFLTKVPTWAMDFAPNGTRLGLGDLMTRKRYADTLETISLHGADIFYEGSMASAMVAAIHGSNGSMTMDDLRNYSAIIREPITMKYQDYQIASCGAPASGAVALSIMKTVEGYQHFGYQESVNLSIHRLDEAMRFGYDFSIPHVRNEFGYAPSPANYIRPRKRPLSSITPMIISHASNNTLYAVLGAAGGSRIITATLQAALNLLSRNMSIQAALAEARLHDQLVPNRVTFEWAYDNSTVASMKRRGHNVTWVAPGYSNCQGIRLIANGSFEAAGDPRQSNSGGLTG